MEQKPKCIKHGYFFRTNCDGCVNAEWDRNREGDSLKESLIKYLSSEIQKGKTEFRISITELGGPTLFHKGIIHPLNQDGDTLDIKF